MRIFCRTLLLKIYRSSPLNVKQLSSTAMDESGLAYIDAKENCNPFDLFKEWLEESKTYGNFNLATFSLATASRTGDVSNRTVVLRDYKDNSLIFVTDENGKKVQHIKENPKVAACFVWSYVKDEKFIKRQVRMEGTAVQLPREECLAYYNKEPLFGKIRSHICQQDQRINWNDLKKKHDELLKEVKTTNKELPMPDHHVTFKIIPSRFDFYLAWDNYIADRLEFIKNSGSGNGWEFHHLAA